MKQKRILVIGSHFSGSTKSLVYALQKQGKSVAWEKPSLRNLPKIERLKWIALMYIEAVLTYGINFRGHLFKTYYYATALCKSNSALIKKYPEVDTVIYIQAKAVVSDDNVKHYLFTDHTNRLSKEIPEESKEKNVHSDWNEIEGYIFNGMDHIFVMGSQVKESMINDYYIPEEKITITGAGPNVDVDIERDGIEKPNNKSILFVGIDSKRKGLPRLINAFDSVSVTHPDAHLHVAGVTGKSTDKITYHGLVGHKELKELYYSAKIFCILPTREPFGIAFIEAMYSKCACIGVDVGGIPDILGSDNVILERNYTDIHLKVLLNHLLSQHLDAEYEYHRAKNLFSWDSVARHFESHKGQDYDG